MAWPVLALLCRVVDCKTDLQLGCEVSLHWRWDQWRRRQTGTNRRGARRRYCRWPAGPPACRWLGGTWNTPGPPISARTPRSAPRLFAASCTHAGHTTYRHMLVGTQCTGPQCTSCTGTCLQAGDVQAEAEGTLQLRCEQESHRDALPDSVQAPRSPGDSCANH